MPQGTHKADDRAGDSKLNRRTFIAAATAAGATGVGLNLASKASGSPSPKPRGDKVRWRIQAQRIEKTFNDGSTVPYFRYVSVGNTPSNGELPLLRGQAGREVTISVENLLDFPIQPDIRGFDSGPVIMPNEKANWKFTMPKQGTWMFTEALLGNVAPAIGLGAPLISTFRRTAKRPYFLVYQDADDRWNNAIDNGSVPNETLFEPNYHTLNGLSYPHTTMDNDTRISCRLDDTVTLHMINMSNISHSVHLHGYHAQITKINNVANAIFPPKDTFPLAPFSTMELEMHIDQIGEFPVHPHSLTSTTDNGLYQGGSVTLIDAV